MPAAGSGDGCAAERIRGAIEVVPPRERGRRGTIAEKAADVWTAPTDAL
jgi:hypothetical protein